MKARRGTTALAALATILALLSVTTLVSTMTWFAPAFWLVVAVAVVGHLVRRTGRVVLVLPAQLLAVLALAVWQWAPATTWYGLPTTATVARAGELLRDFAQTVYAAAAPLPSSPGVELVFPLVAALVAIVVDHVAVTRSAPAAAGMPLLTVFLTAAANSGTALPVGFFLLAAAGWLLLLARHAQVGMSTWASFASRPLVPVVGGGNAEQAASTRFGMIARRLGLTALVAAVLVPAVLPQLPTRYVLDGLARSADARGGSARVGFASTLDVGRSLTTGGSSVVMRYRSTGATAQPMRVLATAAYDGTTWAVPAPTLGRASTLTVADGVTRVERTVSVEDFALDPPALATPQPLVAGDFNGVAWQVDENTSDVYVQTRPRSYSTTYLELELTRDLLRDGVDGLAGPDPLPSTRSINAALRVDPVSAPAVRAAAREAVGEARAPYDKAAAIQEWLRGRGNFVYSLSLPPAVDDSGASVDPITSFLRTKQGYCVQFASAMIMMARAEGIPARMAIGFLPGTQQDGVWTVTAADAHSWPELYFPGPGWVRFEPTPSARTGTAPSWTVAVGVAAPTATAGPRATDDDPLERDPRDNDQAPGTVDGQLTELDQPLLDRVSAWLGDPGHLVLLALALGLAGALVLPATAFVLRRLRSRATGPPDRLVEAQWRELTSRLEDLGVSPPPGATLRDAQTHYARAGYLDDPSREELGRVVSTVELARYARPGTSLDTELHAPAERLVRAVARTRSWRHRARASLLPADARTWWARAGRRLAAGPLALLERLRRR